MLRLLFLLFQSWIIDRYWQVKIKWALKWAVHTGRIKNNQGVVDVHDCAKQAILWKVNNQRLDLRIIDTINSKWKLNYEDEFPTDEA